MDGAFGGGFISKGGGVDAAPGALTGGVGSVGLKLVAPAGSGLSLVKRGAASGVLAIPPPATVGVFVAGMV